MAVSEGKGIGGRIRSFIDIGVPAGMSPDEAKYIRLLNALVLVGLPVHGTLIVVLVIGSIAKGWPWMFTLLETTMLSLAVVTLAFTWRRRYGLGRVYILVLLNVFLGLLCLTAGKDAAGHYSYFVAAGMAATMFPKKETGLMIAMILFSGIAYVMVQILYDYADPLVLTGADRTLQFTAAAAIITEVVVFIGVVAIALIGRQAAIGAEDRLREEQKKLALANEQISLLGDKLKVYLPHQFVESLAHGDRKALPDYKRRRLTVFFSDVQGFTTWTDKLEPEDTRDVLNQYLSEMSAIADKWGGTVDKFIGDAIMVFFGDPEFTNDKDHAMRCVRMAMEMQEKMSSLRAEWEDLGYQEPLHIRIGVNTGYATVGNFGSESRLNYTVLGSAVNLASRLETACAADRITVSHTTWSLIKDEIECEPKGEIEVKGFAEPVKIYEVVGEA